MTRRRIVKGWVLIAALLQAPATLAAGQLALNCILDGGSNCTALIPDASGGTPGQLDSVLAVPAGQCDSVERVCIAYGVEHSLRSDLTLELLHGGATQTLETGSDLRDVYTSTVFETAFDGQDGSGAWTLRATDSLNGEYGALNNWTLGLCCGAGCGDGLVQITPSSGLVTTEAGGQASFDLLLGCHPMRELTITPVSSDPTEGLPDGPIAVNSGNWQSVKTITVTGQDDDLDDGPIAYQVNLQVSQGAAFPGPVDPVLDLFNPPSPFLANPAAAQLVNLDDESPELVATKTVQGSLLQGTQVRYTIVISNVGDGVQPDNPGPEMTDVLPASLLLDSANATAGTAVADLPANTVTWNGSLAPGQDVTVEIIATILASYYTPVANQAQIAFDPDEDGNNNATRVSDDPAKPGTDDSSDFIVGLERAVPALSPLALLLLAALLALSIRFRRHRPERGTARHP